MGNWSHIATSLMELSRSHSVMKKAVSLVEVAGIEKRIFLIRGEKVIIDADLAEFYKIPTKRLNEQVKRNITRFPDDFMFRLTKQEKAEVVAASEHLSKLKYTKSLPNAFTEHGAIMAATVLNSDQAVEMSIFIVRAFIKLREAISRHKELAQKIATLERRIVHHDGQIISLFKAIKQLISTKPVPKKRQIGFTPQKKKN